MLAIVIGELVANLTADISRFTRDINDARVRGQNFATNIGDTMTAAGRGVMNLGATMTKYITLPLVAAGVAVFNLGKDFETEMSHITGLVGVAKTQVDSWGADILKLAPELGKAPKELAAGLYYVTSSGLQGAAAMDALTQSAKASAAGLGETENIANLVTSAINAYGAANMDATKATDILVAAVREGKADAPEFAASLGQVLPIASTMGVKFAEVAGAVAVLTRNGLDAAESTTQIKSILSGLIKPAKGAEDALNDMGTSSAKLRKQIKEEGLLATLQELNTLTKKYGDDALADVFPNIRAFSGALSLANLNSEENKRIIDACTNSTGMLNEAFKAASDTLDFKWNQTLSKAQSTGISLFDVLKAKLIPIFDTIISILDFVIAKWGGMSASMQNVILVVASLAAMIGPVLLVIGSLIVGLGATIASLGVIGATVGAVLTSGFLPFFLTIGAIIGVVIGVIGALVASFIYLWKTNDTFRVNVLAAWADIKANATVIFGEIMKTVSWAITQISAFWTAHGETITKYLMGVWDRTLLLIKFAMETMKNYITFGLAVIRGDWGAAWDAIKAQFSMVWNYLSNIISTKMNEMKGKISDSFNNIKGVIETITSNINLYDCGKKIIQSLIDGIRGMIGRIGTAASEIAQKIRDKFPFSPAKEGPLKDLDKVDFYSSINKALQLAKSQVSLPSISVADEIIKNIEGQPGLNMGFNGSTTNGTNLNLYNPVFNGVDDMFKFMKEMRSTINRYTGRVL
jgi:TP901 family phage tail tape measure protein